MEFVVEFVVGVVVEFVGMVPLTVLFELVTFEGGMMLAVAVANVVVELEVVVITSLFVLSGHMLYPRSIVLHSIDPES